MLVYLTTTTSLSLTVKDAIIASLNYDTKSKLFMAVGGALKLYS